MCGLILGAVIGLSLIILSLGIVLLSQTVVALHNMEYK